MNFLDALQQEAETKKSIVCMGMDPIIEKIPVGGKPNRAIVGFFSQILNAMEAEDVWPGIVKPNYAFFAQYGFDGLKALKEVIDLYKKKGLLVILDAKRGDIGKTSAAYAKECFDFWGADAVTVAPYMGSDSVGPFLEWCDKGKGVYVLDRTSNKGAVDFQNLEVGKTPLYMKTSEKIVEWHKPGIGAVVGATYPAELEKISFFFVSSGKPVSLLIPGVGAQGGSATDVVNALKRTQNPLEIHRINSSAGILYAYEAHQTEDFAGAAVKEIKKLNHEIGL
jgi:orotidine-5'-phosphate decarboxylase